MMAQRQDDHLWRADFGKKADGQRAVLATLLDRFNAHETSLLKESAAQTQLLERGLAASAAGVAHAPVAPASVESAGGVNLGKLFSKGLHKDPTPASPAAPSTPSPSTPSGTKTTESPRGTAGPPVTIAANPPTSPSPPLQGAAAGTTEAMRRQGAQCEHL